MQKPIDFVSVDDNAGHPIGVDRSGQWWYFDRTKKLWVQGYWTGEPGTGEPMQTPFDQYEQNEP